MNAAGPAPAQVVGLETMAELALDLRWSWHHAADEYWERLDPALWELTRNPWLILQTVSRSRLDHALADPAYRQRADELLRAKREAAQSPS